MQNLRVVTHPSCEPVTLAEAREHLLLDDDFVAQDAYIRTLIAVGRRYAEQYTGRAIIQQSLELQLPYFEYEIELPRPNLLWVSYIKYINTGDGSLTTVDPSVYQYDIGGGGYQSSGRPGRVKPAYQQTWPSDVRTSDYNAVLLGYDVGYAPIGSPTDDAAKQAAVPEDIKQWLKMRVQMWYENRAPIEVGTIVANIPRDFVDGLLDPHKLYEF
jgi:uncharacterized phiE125 gp8 family phage protein